MKQHVFITIFLAAYILYFFAYSLLGKVFTTSLQAHSTCILNWHVFLAYRLHLVYKVLLTYVQTSIHTFWKTISVNHAHVTNAWFLKLSQNAVCLLALCVIMTLPLTKSC